MIMNLMVTCWCHVSVLCQSSVGASPSKVLSLSLSFYPGLYRWLYERFRFPAAPVYGGFPVKFRTFLGDPIPYDPNINAAELAEKVSELKLLYG